MKMEIYIYSHERHEAVEAYGDWLSKEQIEELKETDANFLLIRDGEVTTLYPEG